MKLMKNAILGAFLGISMFANATLFNSPFFTKDPCSDEHRDRNETIRIELTQNFFDDIQ